MVALFLFFCVCKSVSIYVILGTQKIKVIDMIDQHSDLLLMTPTFAWYVGTCTEIHSSMLLNDVTLGTINFQKISIFSFYITHQNILEI